MQRSIDTHALDMKPIRRENINNCFGFLMKILRSNIILFHPLPSSVWNELGGCRRGKEGTDVITSSHAFIINLSYFNPKSYSFLRSTCLFFICRVEWEVIISWSNKTSPQSYWVSAYPAVKTKGINTVTMRVSLCVHFCRHQRTSRRWRKNNIQCTLASSSCAWAETSQFNPTVD